jgi:hypothetical protein
VRNRAHQHSLGMHLVVQYKSDVTARPTALILTKIEVRRGPWAPTLTREAISSTLQHAVLVKGDVARRGVHVKLHCHQVALRVRLCAARDQLACQGASHGVAGLKHRSVWVAGEQCPQLGTVGPTK